MADKLMIVMVNTDPANGSELGAPFFQATVAAAMEYEVEVILTGRSGDLANPPTSLTSWHSSSPSRGGGSRVWQRDVSWFRRELLSVNLGGSLAPGRGN